MSGYQGPSVDEVNDFIAEAFPGTSNRCAEIGAGWRRTAQESGRAKGRACGGGCCHELAAVQAHDWSSHMQISPGQRAIG